MSQLSVFESIRDEPDPTLGWGGIVDDMRAVICRIPHVGHARGTWRENAKRPAAYLYFRPDKLGSNDREEAFKRADATAGLPVSGGFEEHPPSGPVQIVGEWGAELPPDLLLEREDGAQFSAPATTRLGPEQSVSMHVVSIDDDREPTPAGTILRIVGPPRGIEPVAIVLPPGLTIGGLNGPIAVRGNTATAGRGWWLRLNGEPERREGSRQSMKPVSAREPELAWKLELRWSVPDRLAELVLAQHRRVLAGAAAVGCVVRGSAIFAEHISQLVLASLWAPEVLAGVGLALAGCEPLSDGWRVHVDAALASGQPWAEELTKLSAQGPRNVLVRALLWMHAHKAVG